MRFEKQNIIKAFEKAHAGLVRLESVRGVSYQQVFLQIVPKDFSRDYEFPGEIKKIFNYLRDDLGIEKMKEDKSEYRSVKIEDFQLLLLESIKLGSQISRENPSDSDPFRVLKMLSTDKVFEKSAKISTGFSRLENLDLSRYPVKLIDSEQIYFSGVDIIKCIIADNTPAEMLLANYRECKGISGVEIGEKWLKSKALEYVDPENEYRHFRLSEALKRKYKIKNSEIGLKTKGNVFFDKSSFVKDIGDINSENDLESLLVRNLYVKSSQGNVPITIEDFGRMFSTWKIDSVANKREFLISVLNEVGGTKSLLKMVEDRFDELAHIEFRQGIPDREKRPYNKRPSAISNFKDMISVVTGFSPAYNGKIVYKDLLQMLHHENKFTKGEASLELFLASKDLKKDQVLKICETIELDKFIDNAEAKNAAFIFGVSKQLQEKLSLGGIVALSYIIQAKQDIKTEQDAEEFLGKMKKNGFIKDFDESILTPKEGKIKLGNSHFVDFSKRAFAGKDTFAEKNTISYNPSKDNLYPGKDI